MALMTGRYGFIISSLYFIICMTLLLTIFIIFLSSFPCRICLCHILHRILLPSLPFFAFTRFLAGFLARSVDIDISFNFGVNVNPVLLVGVDWSKVNIHNVVIGFTTVHKFLELFPFFFHIVFHVTMTILVFVTWASVSGHWAHIHSITRLCDRRVLVLGDWGSSDGGDEDCRKFHFEINCP